MRIITRRIQTSLLVYNLIEEVVMYRAKFVLAAATSLFLTACATGSMHSQTPQDFSDKYYADYDATKVTVVNQWAENKGARVIWINYPPKKRGDGG